MKWKGEHCEFLFFLNYFMHAKFQNQNHPTGRKLGQNYKLFLSRTFYFHLTATIQSNPYLRNVQRPLKTGGETNIFHQT